MPNLTEIKESIEKLTIQEKKELLNHLRSFVDIHPIERDWNVSAEIILEAISRSSDLTQRGVRGIIAEATFRISILNHIQGWEIEKFDGDESYDYKIKDSSGSVSIQVKMQRKKEQRPMMANEGYRSLSNDKYVVETQRTRGGVDPKTGDDTRPYKFGEFDILAVAMEPSTNDWHKFMYTVADWLIPRQEDENLILKFQPVSSTPDDDWTDDLIKCINWLRAGNKKTISK